MPGPTFILSAGLIEEKFVRLLAPAAVAVVAAVVVAAAVVAAAVVAAAVVLAAAAVVVVGAVVAAAVVAAAVVAAAVVAGAVVAVLSPQAASTNPSKTVSNISHDARCLSLRFNMNIILLLAIRFKV
jgi:hypothetical protein